MELPCVSPPESLSSSEERLLSRLQAELGKQLYVVLYYRETNTRPLYVSQSVAEKVDTQPNDQGSECELNRLKEVCIQQKTLEQPVAGEHRCSVQLYDEWLLFHCDQAAEGIIIGVDADCASNLRSFVQDISPAVSGVMRS